MNTGIDVSIILFYNFDRGWLRRARKSVRKQTFTGTFELVEICADRSIAENLNAGLAKAKGEFVKLLADDDELLPNCLQDLHDKATKGFDVVVAKALNYNENTKKITYYQSTIPATVSQLADENTIHGGTTLYRRSMLEAVGGWPDLPYAQEYELHLNLAAKGYRFGVIDKPVYMYRLHNHQLSMQGGFADAERYLQRKRYILHNVQEKWFDNQAKIITPDITT